MIWIALTYIAITIVVLIWSRRIMHTGTWISIDEVLKSWSRRPKSINVLFHTPPVHLEFWDTENGQTS